MRHLKPREKEAEMKKKLPISLLVLLLETTLFIAMAVGELGNSEKQEVLAAQNRYFVQR
jgi:hypothetical protein